MSVAVASVSSTTMRMSGKPSPAFCDRDCPRFILGDPLRHESPQDQSRAVNIAGTRAEECRFFLGDTLNEIFAERVAQRQTSTMDERPQDGIELARRTTDRAE